MAEHRFHTPDPLELDIQIPLGDISVETVDGDESYVSVTGAEKLVEHTRVSLDGNRLSIIRKAGTKPFGITISIGEFSFGSGGLHVVAKVPHHSQAIGGDRGGRHEAPRPLPLARDEVGLRRSHRARTRSKATRPSRPSAATCASTRSAAS